MKSKNNFPYSLRRGILVVSIGVMLLISVIIVIAKAVSNHKVPKTENANEMSKDISTTEALETSDTLKITTTQSKKDYERRYIVYEFVNLRMDPIIDDNNILCEISKGDIVVVKKDVYRESDGYVWRYVEFESDKVYTGWIVDDAIDHNPSINCE